MVNKVLKVMVLLAVATYSLAAMEGQGGDANVRAQDAMRALRRAQHDLYQQHLAVLAAREAATVVEQPAVVPPVLSPPAVVVPVQAAPLQTPS